MNKKLHFLTAALGLFAISNTNAQTTVFEENFDGAAPTGWTAVDSDGDTNNWELVDYSTHTRPGISAGGKMLVSFSYDNNSGPLAPDNYIFSPAIDLSAYTGQTIKLKWKVAAVDQDYDNETYSVYVSNDNTVAAMQASSTNLLSQSSLGVPSLTEFELDISAFAGQSVVYFAFRHHNSSDEFAIVLDDIQIIASTLGSSEFFLNNFTIYPNPTVDVLNIESKNGLSANEIRITDLSGKVVKEQKDATSVNVSDLATGTYIIDVTTNEGRATSKFIKK